MEEESKSNAKCNTKVSKKDSVIVAMSLVLFALMFVRIEVVHRKAEVMEKKLEKRIQRIEDEVQARLQVVLKKMFQGERNPATRSSRYYAAMGKSKTTVF